MYKRLSQPTGEVANNESNPSDKADEVVRSAILVHSAPEGEKVTFQSGDGEISFDDARIKNIIKCQNEKVSKLAEEYGGLDKMPVGAFTPLLDQHMSDSNDRIRGRLISLLRFEKRDVPGVGKNCSCAVTDIKFLGEDSVKRVKDGRIYHLSIGIDENTDTLGEVSTVIEPAAPGAMLLNKSKKGEKIMPTVAQLKSHKDRLAKLGSIKEGIKTLITKGSEAKNTVTLAKRQNEVTRKLGSLMSLKKLTPAEFKKLDLAKLSKLDEETFKTVMSTYEAREDVIKTGQAGSTAAVDFAEIGKGLEKTQFKQLKSEIKGDFKRLGKKLEEEDEEKDEKKMGLNDKLDPKHKDEHELSHGEKEGHEEMLAKHMAHVVQMKKHLEAGEHEKAKELCHMMHEHLSGHDVKHMELGMPEDAQKNMDGVQSQVDELNTQMARLAGMVAELMDAEKAEGESLGEISKEHENLSAEVVEDKGGDKKPPHVEEKKSEEEKK